MSHKLTPKQEAFCLAYLETGNASEAYRRSYDAGRMKPETINRKAKELLDNGKIRARLDELKAPALAKANITLERVLQEIARVAFSDIRRLFDDQGRLLPINRWPVDVAASVASVEVVTRQVSSADPVEVEYIHKLRLWDKDKQIELAGRYLKLFTDRVEVVAPPDITAALAAAKGRAQLAAPVSDPGAPGPGLRPRNQTT